jgi:hypothetical protein
MSMQAASVGGLFQVTRNFRDCVLKAITIVSIRLAGVISRVADGPSLNDCALMKAYFPANSRSKSSPPSEDIGIRTVARWQRRPL